VHVQRYFLERNAQLAQEVLDLVQRLEQVAQGRYSSALGPQQDVIRAQVEQSAMRSELVALEGEGHHLMARLNALLARPVSAPLSAPQQLRALPASSELDPLLLQDRLRAVNPALQAEQSRVQAAQKARELGLRNRYPDVTVGLAPIQYRNAIKEWELMVELTIPLQQSTRRAQEREAEAMLSAATARREALANQVLSELSENLAAIEVARRNEALVASSLLPQAELTLQSALAAYENGKVDFATLLDAQRQIRQAKQSRIKTQLEAHLRLIEVERLLGEDL
jgi:outer membrane protein TolC